MFLNFEQIRASCSYEIALMKQKECSEIIIIQFHYCICQTFSDMNIILQYMVIRFFVAVFTTNFH